MQRHHRPCQKQERQTEPISSDAASCRCTPTALAPLRMIKPTIRHQRKPGTVIAAPSNALPSAWPATTAASAAASEEMNDVAVTGVLTGPPTTPRSSAAIVASGGAMRDQTLRHRAADDPSEDQA